MPLFETYNSNDTLVAIWKVEESSQQLRSQLDISETDLKTVNNFKLDRRKQEWLAARLLLQLILDKYPNIVYDNNGKPSLQDKSKYISISHTFGFVAVSVSTNPTALDIEICSERIRKVAKRFIHPIESEYIDEAKLLNYLTIIWSAKEALYKLYNIEGVIFKDQFIVHPFKISEQKELHCNFINEGRMMDSSLRYIQNEHFTLVFC